MPLKISQMTAASAIAGAELLEVSKLSATVTKTATTISAAATDNSYNDSGSGFVTAGFAVGDTVKVTGFANGANNVFSATITALTAGKMTIGGTDGDVIATEAAGASVTITRWDTRRATAQDIANLAPSAASSRVLRFAIDTSSTSDADPGNGNLRFNNATQPSATVLFIDNQTADAVSLTTYFASLAQTGFITLVKASDDTKWRIYKITAVTSATGYYKLTVVDQGGSGSFSNGDSVVVDIDSDANTGTSGGIPQNSQSTAYTLVLGDANGHILHPSADTTARTFTIPANSSVAYPIGTAITFVNQNGAGTVTIAITTDTMRLAGAGTTGSRTLTPNGIATALKITSTEWIISGTNLT